MEYDTRMVIAKSSWRTPAILLGALIDVLRIHRMEQRLVSLADILTCITVKDRERYIARYSAKKATVIRPSYWGSMCPERKIDNSVPRRICIVGSFVWLAKKRNLIAFLKQGYELFAAENIEVAVVGNMRAADQAAFRARWPKISFTGPVAEVESYIASSRLGVIPEALGGGFKLKTLEYVFNRLPIFALAEAIEDMPLTAGKSIETYTDMESLCHGIAEQIDNLQHLDDLQQAAYSSCADFTDDSEPRAVLYRALDSARVDFPGRTDLSTVVVIGPFPPPMHGMANATASMAEQLRSRCNLQVANISPGGLRRGALYHLVKVARVSRAVLLLLRHTGAKGATLYIPADAGLGMYYTTLFSILARLFRYKIFIHHHSFAYIDKRARRMAVLVRCAGREAVHIFLCPCMERRFRNHYPSAPRYMPLSNAWHITPADTPPMRTDNFLVLGHLSNLGPEKGLYDVLETFRVMLAQNKKVQLILAGPPTTTETRKKIEEAKKEFGDALDYRGPVYGTDKDKFYRSIDVFLFPTHYSNEAQPYVVFEAMSYGVPSICYARGCLAGDLQEGGGLAVPVDANFVDAAVSHLAEWENNSAGLHDARTRSLARAHSHKAQASAEFQTLVDHIAATAEVSLT